MMRCPRCGRFMAYDAYYAQWRCDRDDTFIDASRSAPPAEGDDE